MSETGNRRIRRPPFLRSLLSLDSFGSVLVLIVITYALSVTVSETMPSLVLGVQIITVALTIRVSRVRRGVRLATDVALVIAASVAIAYLVFDQEQLLRAVVFLSSSVLYLIAPVSILRSVVVSREVDREAVLGAIDAYLLIGMFFAFAYQAIGVIGTAPFFGPGFAETAEHYLFFSFTTLTTTGYGNLVPAGNPGQTFAVMEMLIGQLFLITAVAKVISAWQPPRWKAIQEEEAPSAIDYRNDARTQD